MQGNGPPEAKAGDVQGSALKAEGTVRRKTLDVFSLAARQQQQQQQARRGVVQELRQEGVVVDGGTGRRLVSATPT